VNLGTFKTGDIAIFQNLLEPFAFMNGEECKVIDGLGLRKVFDIHGTHSVVGSYRVQYREQHLGAFVEHLKKKIVHKVNDAEFGSVVSWDKCAWNPGQLVGV
jgi:hypothetical protein